MKNIAFVLVISLLLGCSQSASVVQPPSTTIHTIDFGTDPLWREADTTLRISLGSHTAITAITISDSNFTLLDTSRVNDSLRISLRFQPQSVASHSGSCLLLSKQDTLAKLTLLGETSPFERRVGDSYVFENQQGKIDSVWLNRLPITFSYSDGVATNFDNAISNIIDTNNGDWLIPLCGSPTILPTKSRREYVTADSSPSFGTAWTSNSNYEIDSTALIETERITIMLLSASASYHRIYRLTNDNCESSLHASFANDIGFFTDFLIDQDSSSLTGNAEAHEKYHLLRFHLRR